MSSMSLSVHQTHPWVAYQTSVLSTIRNSTCPRLIHPKYRRIIIYLFLQCFNTLQKCVDQLLLLGGLELLLFHCIYKHIDEG